jgi:hypothetical protein
MHESLSEKLLRPCVLSPSPRFWGGHILVDRTLLKFLLLELQKAGEPISNLEIPLLSPVEVDLDIKNL